MSTKRRSYETGHKRKYLVVIDDTEECDRARLLGGQARRPHQVAASSCCA